MRINIFNRDWYNNNQREYGIFNFTAIHLSNGSIWIRNQLILSEPKKNYIIYTLLLNIDGGNYFLNKNITHHAPFYPLMGS